MTTTTTTINPSNCIYKEAAEALETLKNQVLILRETAERLQDILFCDGDVRVCVGYSKRLASIGCTGFNITDWDYLEGDVPGEDVSSLRLNWVYRVGDDDLAAQVAAVQAATPNATTEQITTAINEANMRLVQRLAAELEVTFDEIFLDVLGEFVGVESGEVFNQSFCTEAAEFSVAVVREQDVSRILLQTFFADACVAEGVTE